MGLGAVTQRNRAGQIRVLGGRVHRKTRRLRLFGFAGVLAAVFLLWKRELGWRCDGLLLLMRTSQIITDRESKFFFTRVPFIKYTFYMFINNVIAAVELYSKWY